MYYVMFRYLYILDAICKRHHMASTFLCLFYLFKICMYLLLHYYTFYFHCALGSCFEKILTQVCRMLIFIHFINTSMWIPYLGLHFHEV